MACNEGVTAIDGSFSIGRYGCDNKVSITDNLRGYTWPGIELSVHEPFTFVVNGIVYSMVTIKEAVRKLDTISVVVVIVPADRATKGSVPQALECYYYTVTYDEIEIRYYEDSTPDSVDVQLMAYPRYDTVMVAVQGVGAYEIGVTFTHVTPALRGEIVLDVRSHERPWPVFAKGWGREDNFGVGKQECTLSGEGITYTIRYTIACIGE